jgi:hypothetical protein
MIKILWILVRFLLYVFYCRTVIETVDLYSYFVWKLDSQTKLISIEINIEVIK